PLRARDPQFGGDGQRLLALQRRRPARPGRGDRHLHHPPARLRPDGPGIADHRTLGSARRRPGAAPGSAAAGAGGEGRLTAGGAAQNPRPRLRNTAVLPPPSYPTVPLTPTLASSPNSAVRAPRVTVP